MDYYDILLAKNLENQGDVTVTGLNVTENGTYSESGKAYSPVTVNVSGYTTTTASGNPITLTDASELPLVECKASITATQDLNGYGKPWVGGAGKNKIGITASTQTINDVTITINTDSAGNVTSVTTSGTASETINLVLGYNTLSANTYILNGCASGGNLNTYNLQVTDYPVTSNLGQDIGDENGATFTISESIDVAIRLQAKSGAVMDGLTFCPMVRLATETDATFEPYSNICPISGMSSVTLTHNDTTTTQALSGTCYGGSYDFANGENTVTYGYIASYDSETLAGAWISDRDEYASGTTPTVGAEVAYALSTPTTTQLSAHQVVMTGSDTLSTDANSLDITYFKAI